MGGLCTQHRALTWGSCAKILGHILYITVKLESPGAGPKSSIFFTLQRLQGSAPVRPVLSGVQHVFAPRFSLVNIGLSVWPPLHVLPRGGFHRCWSADHTGRS